MSETKPTERRTPSKEIYRRILRYLRPHRKKFGFALASMVIYGATDGAVPFIIKAVLDNIFGERNEDMLLVLPVALILFACVRGLFAFFQHYLSASVGLLIIQDIRDEISAKLLNLSPSFYAKQTTGSLISRMTNDTLLVRHALTSATAALLRDSIRVISLVIAALYLDPVLGLIAIIGFPLGIYPVLKFGKKVRKLSRVGQDQFGGLTSTLQETIQGYKVVQTFGLKRHIAKRFGDENQKFTRTFMKAEKYGALSAPINEVIASAAIAGIIVYGGASVISGVRTQGDFIAFLTALFLLYEPLKKIGRTNNAIQTGAAAAERIFEIIDAKPDIEDSADAVVLATNTPEITYHDVSFRYPQLRGADGQRQLAIDGVSLAIRTGKTLALVGMSGGGKSTVISLLSRFYDPQQGSISINGRDIRKYTVDSLRRHIATVEQHTFLFNDTVFQNIQFGRLGATREEVLAAAEAAHADTFIRQLPDGYDTVIGEQGFSLSGGERARIAIARALLKDAPVLVLDEATAALDSESEQLVQSAIDTLMEGRTVLVIAHRLATIRKADAIAVMVDGQLAEYGSHEELLAQAGEYAKLYRMQFHGETADAVNS